MNKYINHILHFISGLLFITVGLIYIIRNYTIYTLSFKLIGSLILISSCIKIINILIKKNKIITNLLDFILNTTLGILFITKPNLFIYISTKVFGFYTLAQSLCGFINLGIYKQDKLKGKIYIFAISIISFIIGLSLLFSKSNNNIYICYIIGIYLILYGLTIITSSFINKTKIIIPLPIMFTMILPRILINKIKKGIIPNQIYNYKPYDLEILIHLCENGSASMGHIEFSYQNKIYSYGCYNYLNRKLYGGIGDGILGIFDHDAYIKYCIEEKNRMILSYGIKLNNEQKEKVKKEINKLISTNTEYWYPEIKYYNDGLIEKKDFTEMANQIYQKANGKFYRFTKGKYKTFFVLRTNCAACVDNIIESLNIRTINIEGIISPGTYYSVFETEYKRKNSKVVAKALYNKQLINNLNYQYIKRNNYKF